jgi:hypothetical protein
MLSLSPASVWFSSVVDPLALATSTLSVTAVQPGCGSRAEGLDNGSRGWCVTGRHRGTRSSPLAALVAVTNPLGITNPLAITISVTVESSCTNPSKVHVKLSLGLARVYRNGMAEQADLQDILLAIVVQQFVPAMGCILSRVPPSLPGPASPSNFASGE